MSLSLTYTIKDILISSGGVLIDETNHKVLIIRDMLSGEYLLPKGGKEDNETNEETAVREVYEETGYKNQLSDPPIPLAVQIRPHVNGRRGQHKVIYWFYTRLLSDKQDQNTQQSGEHFQSEWHSYASALDALTYQDDRKLVAHAFHVFNKSAQFTSDLEIQTCLERAKDTDSVRLMLLPFQFRLTKSVIVTDPSNQYILIDNSGRYRLAQSSADVSRLKPFAIQLSGEKDNNNICAIIEVYVAVEGLDRKSVGESVEWFGINVAMEMITNANDIDIIQAFIEHSRRKVSRICAR